MWSRSAQHAQCACALWADARRAHMGVAKGGPGTPQSSSHNFLSWKRWCTVQYCKQCTVRSTPFMLIRYEVLEYRRGQLTTSLVLGFKFLVLALDCQSLTLASDNQSLAFALDSKSLVLALAWGYQSLALALASALDCQSLALSLEVVLDIALNIQIFWQPTQHRLAFSQDEYRA